MCAFLARPSHQRYVLIEIVITALIVEVGLRVCRFHWLLRFLEAGVFGSNAQTPRVDDHHIREVCRLAEAFFRCYPFRLSCLKKALILHAMVSRRGHQTVIKIGVKREGAALQAHAWLELDGTPVAESPGVPETYQAVLSL